MELLVEKGPAKREGDEQCRVTKAALRSWGFIVTFLGFLRRVLGEGRRTACSLLRSASFCLLSGEWVGGSQETGRKSRWEALVVQERADRGRD